MEQEPEDEEEASIEEKLDIILARQDELTHEISSDRAMDADLKRLVKVVLYLLILALVFYIIKSLLTPILAYF